MSARPMTVADRRMTMAAAMIVTPVALAKEAERGHCSEADKSDQEKQ
jgi:hypothetical protein